MSQDLLHSFPSQARDEAVFIFARPYWFAFLPTLFIFILIFGLSVLAQLYLSTLPSGISELTANISILGLGIFELATLIIFLVAVLDFYFDILIVTDRRLVDIDQDQLFTHKVAELNLKDVQDTSFLTNGFFQTYLDYGTVTIETAGERANFMITNVKYPAAISRIISDLADQAKSDVRDDLRYPETETIGVIENDKIKSPADLVARGAMLRADERSNR